MSGEQLASFDRPWNDQSAIEVRLEEAQKKVAELKRANRILWDTLAACSPAWLPPTIRALRRKALEIPVL